MLSAASMILANKTLLASVLLGLDAIKGTIAYSATASWYWPETGNQGACGGLIKNGDWVVALDARHYDQGNVCNKMIKITGNSKTQTARIGDRCEMCRSTDGIDMTPELFSAFADRGVGIIDVTWEFTDGSGGGGNQNEWKPETTTEPPKPEWTSPKEEWKPPATTSKSEPAWTPPASTSSKSEPAWTPPAWTSEESPAPSPTSSQKQSASNFENNKSSSSSNQTSVYSSSSAVSGINSTISANVTATQNSTIASAAASSVLPSVIISIPSQRKESAPIVRNGLAHLHQAVLQVASLIVEAAGTV